MSTFSAASSINTRGAKIKSKIQTRSIVKQHTPPSSSSSSASTSTSSSTSKSSGSNAMAAERKPSAGLIEAKKKARQNFNKNKNNIRKEIDLVRDIYDIAMSTISLKHGDTGVIYDERMTQHCCLWDKGYPECPERFSSVMNRCKELKLFDRCKVLESRSATMDEILIQHTQEQYDLLKETSKCTDEPKLEDISSKYDAIYIHPTSFELSLLSVGSTIELIDNILLNKIQNGMAIIRPPGHHAMKSEYNGYCFFNNVAIAAQYALNTYASTCKRILIVDWDIHHGQATQRMFYDNPNVLYFSIHRFENGTFWPNLRESDFDYIGQDAGKGYNFNVPLNKIGMTNADYLTIFQQLLMPVAIEFQPQLIICSAGYDAAYGCPEGEMEITPACYSHLLSPLMTLADGKIAVILEGGYCLESLGEGAALTLKTLLGDPCPLMEPLETPCESVQTSILNCIFSHRPFWKCLQIHERWTTKKGVDKMSMIKSDCHQVKQLYVEQPPRPERFQTRDCYPIQNEQLLDQIAQRLRTLKLTTNLNYPLNRVCYVYDTGMLDHRNLAEPDYPERPQRIERIERRFQEYKLLDRMQRVNARKATIQELEMVHSKEHVKKMQDIVKHSNLEKCADKYNSVYLHPKTFECATLAVGSVLQVIDNVLNGESRSGVCVVRPPGHHAEIDLPHGFCIFNNIAVAAQYAIECHGLKRILIIDWDVHHGNGTQHIFESNRNVLYISLHRYEYGSFFPKSTDANYTEIGSGNGKGFNVNIPWNKGCMGDIEYITAFQRIIMPIAYEYNPELVLVSAGFDAAIGDPLGGYRVTPEAYGYFTHWLSSLANGRIILCLEGGYNLNSISYAMTVCTKTLLGDPLPTLQSLKSSINDSATETIRNVLRTQKLHWNALNLYNKRLPDDDSESHCDNVEEHIVDELNKLNISDKKLEPIRAKDDDCSNSKLKININYKDLVEAGPSCKLSSSSEENVDNKENMKEILKSLSKEEGFAVTPLKYCQHMDTFNADVLPKDINVNGSCVSCNSTIENWICLHCFEIECGRFINEHMLMHFIKTNHYFTLSLSDLSIWCYGCESYVDNRMFFQYKNLAHLNKFQEPMNWKYDDDDDDVGDDDQSKFVITLT